MNTAIFELCARNLSSSDRRTREAAAATMASTVLLSGRANIADSWREMLDWAIGSCHGEIAALCSVINEDAVYPAFVGQSILLPQTLASQNDDYFVDFGLRIRRLQASLAVTFQIIRLPTDCAVRVPFASILGVITRILSVSPASTPKSAGSKFEAAFLIPAMSTLYADCGKLVGAIACLGDSLSQHASLIRQIVARMVGYSEFKPELRISAYDAASILIRSLPGMMLPLSETLLLATHHDLSGVLAACSSESDEQTDIATGEPHGRKRGTAVVEPKLQLRPNIIPLATSALGLVYSLLVFLGPTLQSVSRKDIDSLLVKLLESSKLPAAVSTVVGKCLSVSAVSHGTRITEAATLLRGTDAFTVDPLVRNRLPPLRRLEEHSEYYQPPERPLQANEPVSDRQGIASSSSEKPAEDRISVSKKVDDIHLRLVDAAHAVSQETVTISPSVAPSQTVGAPIPELAATRLVLTDEVADNNVPLRPTEPQDLPKSVPAYLPVEEKPRTAPDISSPSEADVSKAEAAAKSWVVPVDDSDSDELPEIVLDEEENGDDEEMEDI